MESYEPAFAHILHIRPWEIEQLTYGQFMRGKRFIDDMRR